MNTTISEVDKHLFGRVEEDGNNEEGGESLGNILLSSRRLPKIHP